MWLSYRHHILPSTTIFLQPSGPKAEFNLPSFRYESFLLASQSTKRISFLRCHPSTSHTIECLYSRYWPCLNYFPRRLLSSKLTKSISINSGGSTWGAVGEEKPVSHSQVTSTAYIIWNTAHLDFTRTCYYLWKELPYKYKVWSFILSLGLRDRMIS
jgi:hypothetical protein